MAQVVNLSYEQLQVAQATESLKVQAFAGAGKSTTLLEYARAHRNEQILYLCYNRQNRIEFDAKLRKEGINKVRVATIHSVARQFIYGDDKNVKLTGNLSPSWLLGIYQDVLTDIPDEYHFYLIYHTTRLLQTFCASTTAKIQDYDYPNSITDDRQRSFVSQYYDQVLHMAVDLMRQMSQHLIPIQHDFYVKLFQIRNATLGYHTILFDEVQDASPVMIDIVSKQRSRTVYVGDPHQEIYSWRCAVNTFEGITLPLVQLNQSFRFGQPIATAATKILRNKDRVLNQKPPAGLPIIGSGPNQDVTGKAILARTTVGILKQALNYINTNQNDKVSFQGGLNSYLKHDAGFTLSDVFEVYKGNYRGGHALLLQYDFSGLQEYAKDTEDFLLASYIKLCIEFGLTIPRMIRRLRDSEEKDSKMPSTLFSTIHRIKGLEFAQVSLADDFYTGQQLTKLKSAGWDNQKLIEEINILYIASTRASTELDLPTIYLE